MDKYLTAVKKLIVHFIDGKPIKVYLIGSRAKGTARQTSDVDIAILPKEPIPDSFIVDLRDELEESNIPYTVDIIDLSKLDEEQRKRFLDKAIVWKD